MQRLRRVAALAALVCVAPLSSAGAQSPPPSADWAQLKRYRAANETLAAPDPHRPRVVFFGDSITEFWQRSSSGDAFVRHATWVDRGIRGQTTMQMLVRERADVLELHPAVMVFLGGTNDIAGRTGPESVAEIGGYISSIVDLARDAGIRVIVATVPPLRDGIPQRDGKPGVVDIVRKSAAIDALNDWIRAYARRENLPLVDYHTALADETGRFTAELTYDGVHPNAQGYARMEPLVERAITSALQQASR